MRQAATRSDRVAEAVLGHIVRAGLRPGERLPSEREFGEQLAVSRTVVRSLAGKGVLTVQSGAPPTVARVDADRATEALRLYVLGLEVGPGGLDYAHGLVLDRIRHRDPDGAEAAMNEHLQESRRAWRALDAPAPRAAPDTDRR